MGDAFGQANVKNELEKGLQEHLKAITDIISKDINTHILD